MSIHMTSLSQKTYIQIGCQSKTYKQWAKVTKDKAVKMSFGEEYYKPTKTIVMELYNAYFGKELTND